MHSVVPVVSRRRVAASSVTPPASRPRIPPARGVREPPRAPGDRNKTAPGELETSPHTRPR
jgi:hypothetical protein